MAIKKPSDKKIFYIINYSVVIIGLMFWGHDQYVGRKAWREAYKKSSFNGVIRDTIHYEMQHDLPTYLFTNGSSHLLEGDEGYLQTNAKAGDSLSKISGNDTVYIFRKQDAGKYIQIYPY